jgi:hypothetical protein
VRDFGDWFYDTGLVVVGVVVALLVVGLLGICTVGLVTEIRSYPAVFACESRNLEAVRQEFTTKVVCRPRNYGSDTLNLKTVQ